MTTRVLLISPPSPSPWRGQPPFDPSAHKTFVADVADRLLPGDIPGCPATDVFIAGGAVCDLFRGYTPKDIDIFFASPQARDAYMSSRSLTDVGGVGGKSQVFIDPHIGIPVDLVFCRYGSPSDIVDGFDFTCTQAAVVRSGRGRFDMIAPEKFWGDSATGVVNLSDDTAASLVGDADRADVFDTVRRMGRYKAKGFTLSDATMAAADEALWRAVPMLGTARGRHMFASPATVAVQSLPGAAQGGEGGSFGGMVATRDVVDVVDSMVWVLRHSGEVPERFGWEVASEVLREACREQVAAVAGCPVFPSERQSEGRWVESVMCENEKKWTPTVGCLELLRKVGAAPSGPVPGADGADGAAILAAALTTLPFLGTHPAQRARTLSHMLDTVGVADAAGRVMGLLGVLRDRPDSFAPALCATPCREQMDVPVELWVDIVAASVRPPEVGDRWMPHTRDHRPPQVVDMGGVSPTGGVMRFLDNVGATVDGATPRLDALLATVPPF